MEIIVGEYRGTAVSEADYMIHKRRLSLICFVYANSLYNREDRKLVPSDSFCVIDFHDGEYVNFIPKKY